MAVLPSKTMMKVLADTRCADQVIRFTGEMKAITANGEAAEHRVFLHEWMHYFQFSGTFSGIVLSQWRRECFTSLKRTLTESPDGNYDFGNFYTQLDYSNHAWQAWPADWYQVERAEPGDISQVGLDEDGLHVNFEGSNLWHALPLGHHALFEALAWCGTARYFGDTLPLSKSPDDLVYTWPLWVVAEVTGRPLDALCLKDFDALIPLLVTVCNYDYRLLERVNVGLSDEFLKDMADLKRRNVTVGRLVWQFFRDFERFWSRRTMTDDVKAYLTRIGLPPLSTMLKHAATVVDGFLADREQLCESVPSRLGTSEFPLMEDILAEVDLLQVSAVNLEIIRTLLAGALNDPLLLRRGLASPVCARETKVGYEWFAMSNLDVSDTLRRENANRVLLRQQLSIIEHVMMQLAFRDHLACYGDIDWRLPINPCPAAEQCMALTGKRGIEFCVDQDWRHLIGLIVSGLFNHYYADPPEGAIPGIGAACNEAQAALRGEGSQIPLVLIDYDCLNLGSYAHSPRQRE